MLRSSSGPNPQVAASIQSGTVTVPSPFEGTGCRDQATPVPPPSSSLALLATVPTELDENGDVAMEAPPNLPNSAPAALLTVTAGAPALTPVDADTATPRSTVDPRPTMADVLGQQEHLRRDQAVADAARRRVETPKPLACDIEAIERQYAAGGGWSFIAPRMEQARPYALPRARFDMVIDTGRTFAKTPLQKIIASLSGKSHGNAALEKLYGMFEIGQVSKLPGGNLRVKVKSKEACLALERTKVNILGGVFLLKEFDVLGGK